MLCLFVMFCATLGVWNYRDVQEVEASSNKHIVTFNYNTSAIAQYLPDNTSLKNSLNTYSITVSDGGYAVETSKPGSLISPYYSYVWTYNDSIIDLNTFAITKDMIFFAKWTPKLYTVTFNFESESVKNKITNLQTFLNFTVESPRINLYKPNLEHYNFDGWYDSSSPYEYMYIPERSVGDKVLFARFSPIKYLINYNLDGGSSENPDYYTIEDDEIELFNPTKEGHVFHGWYSDPDFHNPIVSIDTALGRNIDVYPLWELKVYKVTYILPNGLSKVVECEYGEKASLPKNLKKGLFDIVLTDVSRNNITSDTTIHLRYVNIWWVYVLAVLLIAGIILLIIYLKKKRDYTHNKLRQVYHANSTNNLRKK